ncbi:hypothetical protein BGZ80_002843 [Entomortierella chlamydospora]|uniref:Uncharacterized protein n=1 Tax=Entomortierella chlamydospora TaxID=101097 RepID=A0A9P6SWV1_9FUNG|nr:hypothetical protein BGZ79_000633 [Entomortierella chlamydospora]KAG0008998.1 hypothetical protein BGZ80_002843 [Entomortierella chlamydospora]
MNNSINVGSETHADAMNASHLMDSIVSSPAWNQSIFSDSIQLFPSDLFSEARLSGGPEQRKNDYFRRTLSETSAELQESLKKIRLEIVDATARDPSLGLKLSPSSSSLRLDPTRIQLFDRASLQLIQSMEAFEDAYNWQISSQIAEYYSRRHSGDAAGVGEQDTIPGLGLAARDLNTAQETMLNIIKNVCDLHESVSCITDPSSETQKSIEQAKKDLLRSCSEDSGVQATLDRLSTMSATLERARQRIIAGNMNK